MEEGRTQLEYEVYNLKTLRLLVSTGIREKKTNESKAGSGSFITVFFYYGCNYSTKLKPG